MRINNNAAAFNTWASYSQNVSAMKKSMTKLSTGVIGNTDDPAGLGISERMRAEIKGVQMARQNIKNGVSLVQTADGWLQKVNDQLSRMKALAIQTNGIVSSVDRTNINVEYQALKDEINRITGGSGNTTPAASFNGINLFNGTSSTLTVQIGAKAGDGQTLEITLEDLSGLTLDSLSGGSSTALGNLTTAINTVSQARATMGAQQVRMEHSASGLTSYEDNLRAAESKIRDVDMARESTLFAKAQILTGASNAMLAQANQLPQSVLQLLG